MLVGVGTFAAGKLLGPLFSKSLNNQHTSPSPSSDKKDHSDFKVVEDKKVLSVYDSSGEEVFQIDKSD